MENGSWHRLVVLTAITLACFLISGLMLFGIPHPTTGTQAVRVALSLCGLVTAFLGIRVLNRIPSPAAKSRGAIVNEFAMLLWLGAIGVVGGIIKIAFPDLFWAFATVTVVSSVGVFFIISND